MGRSEQGLFSTDLFTIHAVRVGTLISNWLFRVEAPMADWGAAANEKRGLEQ
jgi:hypothetical protein